MWSMHDASWPLAVPNWIVTSRSVKTYWMSRHVETSLHIYQFFGWPRIGRELDVFIFEFFIVVPVFSPFLSEDSSHTRRRVYVSDVLRFSSEIPGWGTRGSREQNEKHKERNAQTRRSFIYAKYPLANFLYKMVEHVPHIKPFFYR